MPILFAISILALVALLWASVSIAHHIRRTRRTSGPSEAILLPDLLEDSHSQKFQASVLIDSDQYQRTPELIDAMLPASVLVAEAQPVTEMQPESLQPAAEVQIAAELAASPQSQPPKFPPAAATPSNARSDWAYFKEDMGDLTDPLPAHPRLRHRAR